MTRSVVEVSRKTWTKFITPCSAKSTNVRLASERFSTGRRCVSRRARCMARFAAVRVVRLVLVLIAITIVSFAFMKAIPGDPVAIRLGEHASPVPAAALRASLGLAKPCDVQLGIYMAPAPRRGLCNSLVNNACGGC